MRLRKTARDLLLFGTAAFLLCVSLLISIPGLAVIPPTPEQLEEYRNDGTLQERIDRAEALGLHRMAPELAQRAQRKLKVLMAEETGETLPEMAPPPRWERLPTTGNIKVLAVGIAFADYPNSRSEAYVQSALFGSGPGDTVYPFESLHNFYTRSSYGKLNLTGDMIGWYTTAYNRSSVTQTDTGRDNLIKEALENFDSTVDYSQYDNDGDGVVDYMIVIWTGPDNGWMNFWWAIRTNFSDSSYSLDGVGFDYHTWLWEEYGGDFDVQTNVHETGHMLGLPDYYDYDDSVGPDGGVGDMDIMDGGFQDHNAFSKFVLDWLTPDIYATGSQTVTVYAMDASESAAIVMPEAAYASDEFYEFFLVENRQLQGNDTNHKGDGLLVWHVDAQLDEYNYNYLFDNSYTDHKLLRVMEADGLEEIEAGGTGDADDFYNTGDTLGPATTPNTDRYDGSSTSLTIDNVSASAATMTFDFEFASEYFSVVSVTASATDTIDILYSTGVDSSLTAVATANYYIDNGIATPTAAVVQADNKTVRLTVPDLTQCEKYFVSISNVKSNNNTDLYLASSPVFVETYWTVIDKNIKDTQTWTTANSPYCIGAGDIYIYKPLTIEAGTVVKFTDSTTDLIPVYGELYVNGTALAPVKFTSAQASPAPGDWNSVYLYESAYPQASIKYAEFTYGYYTLYLNSDADPVVENCSFRNGTVGVYAESTSYPTITSSNFSNTTWGMYLQGSGSVTGTNFDDNSQNGVRVYATDSVTLKDNNFTNNSWAVSLQLNNADFDATHNYFSGNISNTSTSGCSGCSISTLYPLTNETDYTIVPDSASIALKSDGTYSADYSGEMNPTDTLFIQLDAPGDDTAATNDTVVKVVSSITDTTGIFVTLTETGVGTGIFRGTATGSVSTDQSVNEIGVDWGETITVSWVRDSSVDVSVNVAATAVQTFGFTYDSSLGSTTKTVSACAGDVDSDGDIDLVIANVTSVGEGSRVYINDGSGSFADLGIGVGAEDTEAVALVDVDADGDLDVIQANAVDDRPNRIFWNDGSGSLTDSGQSLGTYRTFSIAPADFDRDGDIDFVAGNNSGDPNKLWLNNGSGTFIDSGLEMGTGTTFFVVAADVDNDGDDDYIDGNYSMEPGHVWINNGAGVFSDSGQELGDEYTREIFAADLDADGDVDYIEANGTSSSGRYDRVYTNDGSGTFTDSGQLIGMQQTFGIDAGDLDGDGDIDYVAANYDQPNRVFTNDGSGTFTDSGLTMGDNYTHDVTLGDFDGDGDLDLFEAVYQSLGPGDPNHFWVNVANHTNTTPVAPAITAEGDYEIYTASQSVTLAWTAGSDAETPDTDLLTYDVRIGTTSGGCEVLCGLFPSAGATPWTPYRAGNSGPGLSHSIYLATGTYYWSARTIDNTYKASAWSAEDSFDVSYLNATPTVSGVAFNPSTISPDGTSETTVTANVSDANGLSDITSVTIDLSAIGGPAAYQLYDDGLHGDGSSGDGVFGAITTVMIGIPESVYVFTVTAEDTPAETGIDTGSLTVYDINAPTVTDNQTGDDTWYTADPGAIFDVDFADTGGSKLSAAYYSAWTGAGLTGTNTISWATISSGINADSYTTDWAVDFASLDFATSYISVRAVDNNGNTSLTATDTFYILKDDASPTITDNQTGDDSWYQVDPGAIFDVDFNDTGGAMLSYAQYSAWTGAGMTGTNTVSWATIAANIGANSYTTNWGVDFASISLGTNYISIRAADNAGNMSAVATDAFYVGKTAETDPPVQSNWSPSKGTSLKNTTLALTLNTDENADCKWSLTDQAYSDMSGDCWGDDGTAHSCPVNALSEGGNIVYTACKDNFGNEEDASTNEEIDYTVSLASGSPDHDASNMVLQGSIIGGSLLGIKVSGNYAYIAAAGILSILDISDPANPVNVGWWLSHNYAHQVYLEGSYAYVADDGGMAIVDVSTPSNPQTVSYIDTDDATGIFVTGGYAYIADYGSGLKIIDISDPESPVLAGSKISNGYANDVFVSEQYAYVSDSNNGLTIFDISDPSDPVEITNLATSNYVHDTYVSGDYAYVADGPNGMRVLDISVASSPVEVGFYDPAEVISDINISGDYAYVCSDFVHVLDISTPSAPVKIGEYHTASYCNDVWYDSGSIYAVGNELNIADVTTPSSPVEEGIYESLKQPRHIYVSNGYASITNGISNMDSIGLFVADVSDPSNPEISGFHEMSVSYNDSTVHVKGQYAYVSGGASETRIIDISDPAAPVDVGGMSVGSGNSTQESFYSGGYLYVAATVDNHGELKVYDVSNPASPVEVGSYSDTASVDSNQIYVTEDYAFVGFPDRSIWILDISNPASPAGITRTGSPKPWDIFVSGNYLYDVRYIFSPTDESYLRITDISNPYSVSFITWYTIYCRVYSIYVKGSFLFAGADDGVHVIDFSDPALPVEVGYYRLPEPVINIFVDGNDIYAAVLSTGLLVFDFMGDDEDAPTITDNQTGDDTWYTSDPGAIFDVDFSDTGGSMLSYAQYSAWTGAGMTGTNTVSWATIAANIGANSYTTDWSVDFAALASSTNYISVRAADIQGNLSAVATDVFYVRKTAETDPPVQSNWSPATGSTLLNTVLTFSFDTDENADCKCSLSDQAYADMAGDCRGDGTTSQRCDIEDLSEGAEIIYIACNDAFGNEDTAGTNTELNYIVNSPSGTPQSVDKSNVELIGELAGGVPRDVVIRGNYAYVAATSKLSVIDISTPSAPSTVSIYDTSGDAYAVYISGDYAYVAADTSGLLILDISNPSAPADVGSYDTPGNAHGVFVAGGYAYVCDKESGLRIIDVSDPANPTEAGYYDTSGWSEDVYVSGGYAYVADGSSGLRILDVTNVSSPSEIGSYNTPGSAWALALSGGYAYVADTSSGLRVIDISNPASPSEAGLYDGAGEAQDIVLSGNYAYIANGESGLQVIDISTPASPSEAGVIDTPGDSYGVYLSGTYAYVADQEGGFRVMDVSTPAAPSEIASILTPGNAYGLFVSGNYAYIAENYSLQIIDISTPSAPAPAGYYDTGSNYDIQVVGNYAYVTSFSTGFEVFDITTPSAPSSIGAYSGAMFVYGLFVSGNYAYVTTLNNDFNVVDISTPSAPVEVGSTGAFAVGWDVHVSGNYAYVAANMDGLKVVDVSTPASPTVIGTCGDASDAYDVFVSGNYAYVAGSSLFVVDISTPSSPTLVGEIDTPGTAMGVYVSGNYAYVGSTGNGLYVIDVSNPASPSLAGYYNTPGDAWNVFETGGYIYLADYENGLQVFQYAEPDTDAPTITDNQTGDDTWYTSDPGSIFDVDFSDTGGSMLSYAQYTVWNASGMSSGTGTEIITWATIATDIDANSYTTDWSVDFASFTNGANYVSVRAADNAGNMSAVATDVFYVKKAYDYFDFSANISGSLPDFAADVDGDGDADFIGGDLLVYLNDGAGNFTNSGQDLGSEDTQAVSVVDMDLDGDLDIMAGNWSSPSRLWTNDGSGTFSASYILDTGSNLTDDVETPDLNSDGYPDVLISGFTDVLTIWINNSATGFTEVESPGGGMDIEPVDVDGDGDRDVVASSRIYINDGNAGFTDSGQSLHSVNTLHSFAADVDADGDYDLIMGLGGTVMSDPTPDEIWLNDGNGVFSNSGQALENLETQCISGGDFDGDGDIDFIAGYNVFIYGLHVYLNDGTGVFSRSGETLGANEGYSIFTADADNDGDLDVFSHGRLFTNTTNHANTAPVAPTPTAEVDAVFSTATDTVTLQWTGGSDAETPDSDMLAYDVRIGTTSGGCDIFCGYFPGVGTTPYHGTMRGNAGATHSLTVALGDGTYYWAVRTIDPTYKYGAWSTEDSFEVDVPDFDAPTITDNQSGDDTWYTSDPGAIFDVDFSDAGGSMLSYAQYSAWTGAGMTGTNTISWATVAASINSNSYTTDWGVDFAALASTTNYISVRAADNAGNMSAVATDAFYVNKYSADNIFDSIWSSEETEWTISVAWGDYDGDGDLDQLIGGFALVRDKVYENDGGNSFTKIWTESYDMDASSIAWGDYNGDGRLDILAGNLNEPNQIHSNEGGDSFVLTWSASGVEMTYSVAWGDFDNDGDLDQLIGNGNNEANQVMRNDGGANFALAWSSTETEDTSSAVWGDYDGDGDLDQFIVNKDQVNRVYRNDGNGGFTSVWASSETEYSVHAAIGDYDGDGSPDLLVANYTTTSRIYGNDGGDSFSIAWTSTETDNTSEQAWGDYDGDGDLDILAGNIEQANRLYSNNGGGNFSTAWTSIETEITRSVAWGDYDNDGDLDQLVGNNNQANRVYRNNLIITNTDPVAPTLSAAGNETVAAATTTLSFAWTAGSDAETTDAGLLTYDLCIGTASGACDIFGGLFPWSVGTDMANGYGNTGATTSHSIALATGTYYWSARTVDTTFARSAWSAEDSFTISFSTDTPPVQSNWNPAKGSTLKNTTVTLTFDTDKNADCLWSLTDQAYADMAGDCWGDGTTSQRCDMDGLSEGAEIVYIACASDTGSEDTAQTNEHVDFSVTLPAVSPPAENKLNVDYVGALGFGKPYDVQVSGNYAYFAAGNLMSILDISNPDKPVQAGSLVFDLFSSVLSRIIISGSYAYIAKGDDGILIVDVSDPQQPLLIGEYNTPGFADGISLSGSYLYVADSYSDLRVIDISDPENPSEVASYTSTPGNAADIYISGRYAFIADYGYGLRILDIHDHSNITEVGFYDTPGTAFDVFVSDGYAYVADYDWGVRIIDVSDPTSPSEVSSYEEGVAGNVYVSGDYLYVLYGDDGMKVLDVSDPSDPTLMDSYDSPGAANGIDIDGDTAYLADGDMGMSILDVSNKSSISVTGSLETILNAVDIFLSSEYLYIADSGYGLRIVDVSDSSAPVTSGTYEHSTSMSGVCTQNETAYVVQQSSILRTLDISDINSISILGYLEGDGYFRNIQVVGNYAYIAGGDSGLNIVDISSPESPSFVSTFDTSGTLNDLHVSGNTVYAADGTNGMLIFDVSDTQSPTQTGHFSISGTAQDIYVNGNYAYLLTDYGLRVIDVSSPASPTEVASYNDVTSGSITGHGSYIFIADTDYGLRIIDVSNPLSPSQVGYYETDSYPANVAVSGDIVYVGNYPSGLQIFRFTAMSVDTISPTITDNQDGDDTEYTSDPGAIFDVDFADTGGSMLSYAQYTAWSGPAMSGSEVIAWTNIATGIYSDSYTTEWGVYFSSLATGTNYISVRAADNAGNMSAVATDAFYVVKGEEIPEPESGMNFYKGWNFIGNSGINQTIDLPSIFGENRFEVWNYESGALEYVTATSSIYLTAKEARWVYYDGDTAKPDSLATAIPPVQVSISLENSGWNAFTTPFSNTKSWNDSTVTLTCGSQQALPTIYRYDTRNAVYSSEAPGTGSLYPWIGYWIYTPSADCTLVIKNY